MKTGDYSSPKTKHDNLIRMQNNFKRLESLADQTAVHRKKIEFGLSQLRNYAQIYSQTADSTPLTSNEIEYSHNFTATIVDLRSLIIQNLLQNWTNNTIENPADTVLKQIREVFVRIRKIGSQMNEDASVAIKPDSPEWIQYHLLDLRAIHASFIQYRKLPDFDKHLAALIDQRLQSIDDFFQKNASETNIISRTYSPIPVTYQSWRVSIEDFEEVKSIGNGVSATVFYGKDKRTNEEVAIKKFKFAKINGSKLQSFQREVAVLATAIHPSVIKLVGATDSMPFCIITEWMPNGTLYHDLHYYHHLDQTGKTIAAFDIARGMQFLHKKQIVHRDLKSLNILLDQDHHIRICDFGFSRHASDSSLMSQNIGTPHWMAPEILSTTMNYTSKVDVYAYGIVLWEIATGQTPYQGKDSMRIINDVRFNDSRPFLPADINPPMRDLITQCWDRDPDVRPTFDEIVRKFEKELVMMNDCNRELFSDHVRKSITSSEMQERKAKEIIKKILTDEIEFDQAVKQLKEITIPHESIDSIWNIELVEKNKITHPSIVADYLEMFIKTSKLGDVSTILRSLPKKSVSPNVINKLVDEIPTGSIEIDTDIVVAGCRNGAHDLVALYSVKFEDTILALNVCANEGVDKTLKTAVVDRCVQCLVLNNADLAAAALRCLISLDELRRIQFDTLSRLLFSIDVALCSCAYLALAQIALEGRCPPDELLEKIYFEMEHDHRAGISMIAFCKNPEVVPKIVKFMESKPFVNDDSLKTLVVAANIEELHVAIKNILDHNDFEEKLPEQIENIKRFKRLL